MNQNCKIKMLLQPTKEVGRAGAWRGPTGASFSNVTSNSFPRAQPELLTISRRAKPSQQNPLCSLEKAPGKQRFCGCQLLHRLPPAQNLAPTPQQTVLLLLCLALRCKASPAIFDMHSRVGAIRLAAFRLRPLEELIMFLNHVCKRALISRWPGECGHFVPLNPCLWPTIPNTGQPSLQTFNVIRFKEWVINIERCDCS